ncbi:MAG: phenylacetic acid degradation operon negative regulatory protein PaaX [Acidimicrobiales bacterium]|nr:phenylacetic acid degradation operon negative regulatory protein PaaX [Acidimicrobiales bacterium]
MNDIVAEAVAEFGARPGISARSVLVTLFGDSIVPAGGELWLADLIGLCAPFGFNDRLVRTSMFRLSTEGWFETERVGRHSRYRLTETAIGQFAAAETRIYHRRAVGWDGQWTLAFLDGVDRTVRDAVAAELRWAGFAALSPGVLALPRPGGAELVARAAASSDTTVPVATARFEDVDALVRSGWLTDSLGLGEPAERYRSFLERYRWVRSLRRATIDDGDALSLRTMVVHDYRRARLTDPDLPAALLPADWPAADAYRLAADAYRLVSPGAWRALGASTGLTVADAPPVRFP